MANNSLQYQTDLSNLDKGLNGIYDYHSAKLQSKVTRDRDLGRNFSLTALGQQEKSVGAFAGLPAISKGIAVGKNIDIALKRSKFAYDTAPEGNKLRAFFNSFKGEAKKLGQKYGTEGLKNFYKKFGDLGNDAAETAEGGLTSAESSVGGAAEEEVGRGGGAEEEVGGGEAEKEVGEGEAEEDGRGGGEEEEEEEGEGEAALGAGEKNEKNEWEEEEDEPRCGS